MRCSPRKCARLVLSSFCCFEISVRVSAGIGPLVLAVACVIRSTRACACSRAALDVSTTEASEGSVMCVSAVMAGC